MFLQPNLQKPTCLTHKPGMITPLLYTAGPVDFTLLHGLKEEKPEKRRHNILLCFLPPFRRQGHLVTEYIQEDAHERKVYHTSSTRRGEKPEKRKVLAMRMRDEPHLLQWEGVHSCAVGPRLGHGCVTDCEPQR